MTWFSEFLERCSLVFGEDFRLWESQKECLKKGAADKDSLIVTPTAAGKTLVAEARMFRFLRSGEQVLYVSPLISLTSEKVGEFRDFFVEFSVEEYSGAEWARLIERYGEKDARSIIRRRLENADLVVATIEGACSILAKNLYFPRLVVVDECHMLLHRDRGVYLETLLKMCKMERNSINLTLLSATVGNAGDLARSLNLALISSEWRPTKLIGPEVHLCAFRDPRETIFQILEDDDGAPYLVFLPTRWATENYCASFLQRRGVQTEDLSIENYIREGCAFHHAGLSYSDREMIEEAFRNEEIAYLFATTTLAMGVNLPSKSVIVVATGKHKPLITEVFQMAGRAGRPGKWDTGFWHLVTDSETFASRVLNAELERITSPTFSFSNTNSPEAVEHIGAAELLSYLCLEERAGSVSESDILSFHMGFTLGVDLDTLVSTVSSIDETLLRYHLLEEENGGRRLTRHGRLVASFGVGPLTYSILNSRDSDTERAARLHVLQQGYGKQTDVERGIIYWINNFDELEIKESFKMYVGDFQNLARRLEVLSTLAGALGKPFEKDFVERIRRGCTRGLLPLARIRGVGRKFALGIFLFCNGDLEKALKMDLSRVMSAAFSRKYGILYGQRMGARARKIRSEIEKLVKRGIKKIELNAEIPVPVGTSLLDRWIRQ